MATMPALSPRGQPATGSPDWFGSAAGQALLESEAEALAGQLADSRGLPWLWLGPVEAAQAPSPQGRGMRMRACDGRWIGDIECGPCLPLAGESIGAIVLQHVLTRDDAGVRLLQECARVLVPGARLSLFALNPLAPYRLRWRGEGLGASEPLVWRRRLRGAGLSPEPLSQGVGPSWRVAASPQLQQGAGLRAAYLLRAEKRTLPLTPVRQRARMAPSRTQPVAGLAAAREA